MYYSVNQPPPSISHHSSQAQADAKYEPLIRQQRRRLYWFLFCAAFIVFGGGAWWYGVIQKSIAVPVVNTKTAPSSNSTQSKPEVAGVTFGDILKKQRTYVGWLAGIVEGNIVIMNPQSGEINTLTHVENQWFGPVSNLSWSPDRTKLAYLLLPREEAEGFAHNPEQHARKMGLESVPTPQTFPFGQIVILDINTKQTILTKIEVRNTPKSIIWLDENRLAAITSGLTVYNLADQQSMAIAGAGVTDENGQLQSPLAWDSVSETIFYTKVKKTGDQAVRLAMQVSLTTNAVKELTVFRTGPYDSVSSSRNIDMALSSDGSRLAFITEQSMAYLNVEDRGIHTLPPQDDWLWLKDSILSDVEWLSPSRVAFTSLAADGAKVWAVWDIPESKILTFGRGMSRGSWDKTSGRLGLLNINEAKVSLLTPNWQNTLDSTLEVYDLPWQSITW